MSTYLSSLLTTTQRFRALLPTGESDGDTPDDTHICRVLRAYYTEKGRAYPSWLPPDPKSAPAAALPGNAYGGAGGYGGMAAGGAVGGGQSKLGSLWDKPGQQQEAAPQQPMSLRQGRVPVGGAGSGQGGSSSLRAGGLARRGGASALEEAYAPRPLPSQRDGSYQAQAAPPLQQVASAGSAQDRLKNRLFGGRSGNSSPVPSGGGGAPPPGPGGGLRPQQAQRQPSYESGGQDRLDTRGNAMAANQPWAGGGDPYAQEGRRSGAQQQQQQRGYR